MQVDNKVVEAFKTMTDALQAGWAEATATDDKIANTKVLITLIENANIAVMKVVAPIAKVGGQRLVDESFDLADILADLFEIEGFSPGSIMLALSAHMSPQLEILRNTLIEAVEAEKVNINS